MQRSDGLFSALAEVSRRDFMKLCTALAATMGLSSKAGAEMTAALTEPKRPPVLWIGAQECTGCTESLLRATHPTVENLVLEMISLEYHETLSAAFGEQAEDNKHNAIKQYYGKYVLVVDGSIPVKDGGVYCMVAGKPIVEHIQEAAKGAAAIIAIGSCAAWGGVPSSGGNPTGASSLSEVLPKGTPVINIPGCPPTPAATIYGFAVALGLLDQKLKGKQEKADPNAEAKLRFPTIPLDLRISLEREARRLAGYRQGGNIANQFMAMMTENDKVPFGVRLGEYLEREADPRLSEIVNRLHAISLPFSG